MAKVLISQLLELKNHIDKMKSVGNWTKWILREPPPQYIIDQNSKTYFFENMRHSSVTFASFDEFQSHVDDILKNLENTKAQPESQTSPHLGLDL